MNGIARRLAAALAAAALVVAIGGCQKEGPMERAGKSMDKAVDNVKDAVKPK